jgi:hypothetical protein
MTKCSHGEEASPILGPSLRPQNLKRTAADQERYDKSGKKRNARDKRATVWIG